jgi:methyl-accepting chemotaxis protein-2 (aspartate sensor receptor)
MAVSAFRLTSAPGNTVSSRASHQPAAPVNAPAQVRALTTGKDENWETF